MNAGQDSKNGLFFANFNQSHTHLAVGYENGFKIFQVNPYSLLQNHGTETRDLSPPSTFAFPNNSRFSLRRTNSPESDGGYGVVEMLYTASLVVLVGAGNRPSYSPRKLTVLNTQENKKLTALNFVTAILAVRLNKSRLVVVLETRIHIYDMANLALLYTIETGVNPLGLVALALEANLLAYPGTTDGTVAVFDLATLTPLHTITAHNGPLAALAFTPDARLLATASNKGTLVRVWRGTQLEETFRRGSVAARIYCLAWNPACDLLAVSSDKGTVHLFRLGQSDLLAKYLPTQVTNLLGPVKLGNTLEQNRSEALVRLPTTLPTVCALDENHIYIAAADSYLYTYKLGHAIDGVLTLQHQSPLL